MTLQPCRAQLRASPRRCGLMIYEEMINKILNLAEEYSGIIVGQEKKTKLVKL